MRQKSSVLALMLIILSVAAGCTTPRAAPPDRNDGTVTGTLFFAGPGRTNPVPGEVVAANSASGQFTATADASGRFRLELPPSSYQLTGRSPQVTLNGAEVQCNAIHAIRVTAHETTRGIKVSCYLI
jgi:hypothetical protein